MLLSDAVGSFENGLESCLYHLLLSSVAGTLTEKLMGRCHREREKVVSEPPPPSRSVSFLCLPHTPEMEVFASGVLVVPSTEFSVGQKLGTKLLSSPSFFFFFFFEMFLLVTLQN